MRGCRLGSGHYITQAVELISANDDTRAAQDGGEKKKQVQSSRLTAVN